MTKTQKDKKIIAMDMRSLNGISKYRGIGMYLAVITNLCVPVLVKKYDIFLYTVDDADLSFIDEAVVKMCKVVYVPAQKKRLLPERMGRILAELFPKGLIIPDVLPDSDKIDLFFQPYLYHGLPEGSQKNIVVAHDLIPAVFSQHYFGLTNRPNKIEQFLLNKVRRTRQIRYKETLESYVTADKVLAVSQSTKNDLALFTKTKKRDIKVTHLGPPKINNISDVRLPANLAGKDFIFYIGGIDYRRDLAGLVEAFEIIRENTDISLVIAGKDFENIQGSVFAERIRTSKYKDQIINLGFVDDSTKQALFQSAVACTYPTLYEGFGLPLLEAFAYGCPIVTYSNSSVPEVGGSAALYAENPSDLADKISQLINSEAKRQKHIKAGYEQAKLFSWEKCAKLTVEAIEQAIEGTV